MSKLLVVDGHAVIHRAYHSIPELTLNGQPVNAIYGFYSMLLSAISQLNPKYLIVCLDSPGPTFRQSEFVGYRAKRKVPDHSLISQLPLLKSTLEESGIKTFSMGGYEADDLIATVVKKASKKNFIDEIVIITGDKDLMQLIDSKTSLLMPLRGLSETKIFEPEDVVEKLGVKPSQVVDLKALMGDMSDSYPGVAGIGPKVATDLLTEYQNLDNIYQNLDNIKPTIKEKLVREKENAYLSQKLATLIDNIPIKFKMSQARWNQNIISGLNTLFKNYNFKSLINRLDQPAKPKQNSLF
ncbi:MAG: 5'-3' exonuclease H3TH domain-containing protein [Candidatus Shapirobacteria bacterium]